MRNGRRDGIEGRLRGGQCVARDNSCSLGPLIPAPPLSPVPEERKKLKLRDPERYNWHPRQLIAQLASIHVRLFRTDPAMWIEACVADSAYLGGSPSILPECVKVLRSLSLLPEADIAELQVLHERVGEVRISRGNEASTSCRPFRAAHSASSTSFNDQARKVATEEEEEFDDVPGEFEDPLLGTIMKDPVKLPSGAMHNYKETRPSEQAEHLSRDKHASCSSCSGTSSPHSRLPRSGSILDRATILTHLLTDQRDPFSRLPMTESDIVAEEELKERIQTWIGEQREAVRQKKMQATAGEDMDVS